MNQVLLNLFNTDLTIISYSLYICTSLYILNLVLNKTLKKTIPVYEETIYSTIKCNYIKLILITEPCFKRRHVDNLQERMLSTMEGSS